MSEPGRFGDHELPTRALLQAQARRLAGMRARLLRRVEIAHRGPVLDLGAGWGAITDELVRRSRGPVVAADHHPEAVAALGERGVLADARDLPFADGHFALVFVQCMFLYNPRVEPIGQEIHRVLGRGGVLVAIEPDYGGMMEHPESITVAPLWRSALARAGADPQVGRRLPSVLRSVGFEVQVDLVPQIDEPAVDRFELLASLPLSEAEQVRLNEARAADATLPAATKLVHLPFLCVTARR